MLKLILNHKAFLITLLTLTLSEVLPFIKSTQWNGLLQGVLSLLKKAPVAIFMIFVFGLSACSYCMQAANKSTARCKAEAITKQCGSPAVMDLVSKLGPQVIVDLLSGNYSGLLNQLIATLTSQGIPDALTAVTCTVQNASANLKAANLPDQAKLIKAHADAWLSR